MWAEVFSFSSPLVFVLESQSSCQMACPSGQVVQDRVLFAASSALPLDWG